MWGLRSQIPLVISYHMNSNSLCASSSQLLYKLEYFLEIIPIVLNFFNILEAVCACCHFDHVQLFETLQTIACWAPLSMGFYRQEYWSGLPHPPLGDVPDPGIKPASPVSPALADRFFTTSTTWEALEAV